jgi:hypothetical protein
MSAPENIIDISGGDAVLGLIVLFCIAAIWAAAGKPHHHDNRKEG